MNALLRTSLVLCCRAVARRLRHHASAHARDSRHTRSGACGACHASQGPGSRGGSSSVPAVPLKQPAPMQLVVLANPQNPIVSFRLVFHTGSIDDPKGKEGLTALTANLLSEGGTRELTSAQLLEALFPMAAELEVRAGQGVHHLLRPRPQGLPARAS